MSSEIAKKALEVMQRHNTAYVLFLSDKTLVVDPDMEEVYEFNAVNIMSVYRELIGKAPWLRMRDHVITVSKTPRPKDFKGL